MAKRRNYNRFTIRKNDRGITLVEMIVVLVIMAILAASGIFTGVGYIKRSRFNQNEANAEIIYNAIQTALQQKERSGTIEDWSSSLITKGTALDMENMMSKFDTFPTSSSKPNDSVHMRYVLTFTSGSSSDAGSFLKDLIQPYFYDKTIFKGTITAEFLVEKTLDAYKTTHCFANCLSVFADSHTNNGWGSNVVPSRDFKIRRNMSLVGYYEGYEGKKVDTVYLPQAQLILRRFKAEKEIITVTPTPGSSEGSGSGEGTGEGTGEGSGSGEGTGEEPELVEEKYFWLSWSATQDKANIIGVKQNNVYYKIELLKGSNVAKELILNESFMHKGNVVGDEDHSIDYTSLKDMIDGQTLEGHKVSVDTYPVEYDGFTENATIKSITIDAQIYIKPDGDVDYDSANSNTITTNLHDIKLKISYVEHEYNSDHTEKEPYYIYSLDITDLLDDSEIDGARMTVYPNDFKDDTMKAVINTKALIPFRKGLSATIEQEEEETLAQEEP